MAVKIPLHIWVLTLMYAGQIAVAAPPFTYWVHSSCITRNSRFLAALAESLVSARSAANRLRDQDSLQLEYFQRLFKPTGNPGDLDHAFVSAMVIDKFGNDEMPSSSRDGVGQIIREPRNNQTNANFRFYCDNDRLDGGRWRLRSDPPPEQRPRDYVLQADRSFILNRRSPRQPFQEFEDPTNQILMGESAGCHKEQNQAASYRELIETSSQPLLRATITVGFKIAAMFPMVADQFFIISFATEHPLSSPKSSKAHRHRRAVIGEQAGGARTGSILRWQDLLALEPGRQIGSTINYVYFAMLAHLRDFGYRLARNEYKARNGIFERV
ncbi:MAG: hypothetical protein Q9227_009080 [Pyrenula ochraceoflavens]